MGKFLRKSVFAKVETTYGVNASPLPADVMLAENVDINPLEMQTDDYTPVSNQFGQLEKIVGAVWCSARFDVVVGGGGTPLGAVGSVPNHDPILRAGAMSRTITAGTNIVYNAIDSGEESVTMAYHADNARFGLLGLRGDLEWIFEVGKAPRLRFAGIGLREPMTDVDLGPYSLPVRPRPVAMTKDNTIFQLNGSYNLRCSQLNIKLGNKMEYINRSNQEEVLLTDRMSSGSITFELPTLASQDFLGSNGLCTRATQVPLIVQFGNTPGNRVSWNLPAIQLFNPRLGGDKGTTMLTCDIHLVKNQLGTAYF